MMTVRAWLFTLAVGLVTVAVISGARNLSLADDPIGFDSVRHELGTALDEVDGRLRALQMTDTAQVKSVTDEAAQEGSPPRLRARHDVIVARLESLAGTPESEWRGAVPGLRAALADLEHRVDVAELEWAGSRTALDTLMAVWLVDVEARLAALEHEHGDLTQQRVALDAVRSRCSQIGERFELTRRHAEAADLPARRALARELAEVRRSLRAVSRSLQVARPRSL